MNLLHPKYRTISPCALSLAMYLRLCPYLHFSGLFHIPLDELVGLLNLEKNQILNAFKELETIQDAYYDVESRIVYLPDEIPFALSPQQCIAIEKQIKKLPFNLLVSKFLQENKKLKLKGLECVTSPYPIDRVYELEKKCVIVQEQELELGLGKGIIKGKTKTRSKIPKDFELDAEKIAIAKKHGLNGEMQQVFEEFKSHWLSCGDMKADWIATWENNVIKQAKYLKKSKSWRDSDRMNCGNKLGDPNVDF